MVSKPHTVDSIESSCDDCPEVCRLQSSNSSLKDSRAFEMQVQNSLSDPTSADNATSSDGGAAAQSDPTYTRVRSNCCRQGELQLYSSDGCQPVLPLAKTAVDPDAAQVGTATQSAASDCHESSGDAMEAPLEGSACAADPVPLLGGYTESLASTAAAPPDDGADGYCTDESLCCGGNFPSADALSTAGRPVVGPSQGTNPQTMGTQWPSAFGVNASAMGHMDCYAGTQEPHWEAGTKGFIVGLVHAQHFNGSWCLVEGYDPASDRCVVRLLLNEDELQVTARLRPSNLLLPLAGTCNMGEAPVGNAEDCSTNWAWCWTGPTASHAAGAEEPVSGHVPEAAGSSFSSHCWTSTAGVTASTKASVSAETRVAVLPPAVLGTPAPLATPSTLAAPTSDSWVCESAPTTTCDGDASTLLGAYIPSIGSWAAQRVLVADKGHEDALVEAKDKIIAAARGLAAEEQSPLLPESQEDHIPGAEATETLAEATSSSAVTPQTLLLQRCLESDDEQQQEKKEKTWTERIDVEATDTSTPNDGADQRQQPHEAPEAKLFGVPASRGPKGGRRKRMPRTSHERLITAMTEETPDDQLPAVPSQPATSAAVEVLITRGKHRGQRRTVRDQQTIHKSNVAQEPPLGDATEEASADTTSALPYSPPDHTENSNEPQELVMAPRDEELHQAGGEQFTFTPGDPKTEEDEALDRGLVCDAIVPAPTARPRVLRAGKRVRFAEDAGAGGEEGFCKHLERVVPEKAMLVEQTVASLQAEAKTDLGRQGAQRWRSQRKESPKLILSETSPPLAAEGAAPTEKAQSRQPERRSTASGWKPSQVFPLPSLVVPGSSPAASASTDGLGDAPPSVALLSGNPVDAGRRCSEKTRPDPMPPPRPAPKDLRAPTTTWRPTLRLHGMAQPDTT